MARLAVQCAILSAGVLTIPLIVASAARAAVCTEQYAPVCGQVGRVTKTYSNSCFARADGAKVIAHGPCGARSHRMSPT
jgi:Kazal-type serine protease inhibitor domain